MKDEIGLLRFWLPSPVLLGVLLVPVIVQVARSVRVGGARVPEQPATRSATLRRRCAATRQFPQHPEAVVDGRPRDLEPRE